MTKYTLNADERKVFGRKVKKLREEGLIPANIYGKKIKSVAVQINKKEFEKIFKEAGETSLVDLVLGTKKHSVLIHNTQHDPIYSQIIHADFFEVDLKEKVTANIPVELIGVSPADKSGLGTLVQQIDEIEVEALPMDLPVKFEVDVSKLEKVDDSVSISDLKVDTKTVDIKSDPELIIAKVEALRDEEEEPAPVAEGTEETPVEGEPTGEVKASDSQSEDTPEEK